MRIHRLTLLPVVLALLAVPLQARIILNGFDAFPLDCTSREDAIAMMKERMGAELYDQLDRSSKSYYIAFQEADEIVEETGHKPQFVREKLTGYFEKDLEGKNSYTIHVNTTWIADQLEARLAKDDMKAKTEEERERWKVYSGRLLACGILAHEGTHAAELERAELDFSPKILGKSIHVKIAMDCYDEYFAHVAQYKALKLEGDVEAQAKADVSKNYPHLKPIFFVVKDGKAVPGQAPFPWAGASDAKTTASDAKSFGQFVTEAAALGGRDGAKGPKKPKKPREKGRSETPEDLGLDLVALSGACGNDAESCPPAEDESTADAKAGPAGGR